MIKPIEQYVNGEIDREELIEALVAYPYAKVREVDEYDGTWEPGPNTFLEVGDANDAGFIDDSIYEEVLRRMYPDRE